MLNMVIHGEPTDKPPLLIAHGLFGSARNWGVIAKRLSATRQVIAIDLRNHGDSPWFDRHTYAAMADDLAEVMTQPMDVLGHSMGGKAAMTLAATRPDLVHRLIVVDIAPVGYAHSQLGPLNLMRGVDLATIKTRKDAAAQMGNVDDGLKAFLLQSLDMKEKRWMLNLDVLQADMVKIIGFPARLDPSGVPALFLRGATSDYVLPEHHAAIMKLFPNARIQTIENAGHWVHAEQPRSLEAAVETFLTESPAP